jgi:hypothetical protein
MTVEVQKKGKVKLSLQLIDYALRHEDVFGVEHS